MTICRVMLLIFVAFASAACASDDGIRLGSEPENAYQNSNADPSAYGADAFTFRKKQNLRAPNNFMFYYKRCSLTSERSYYSKTDYFCHEP